jgi:molecular chaperone DnaK (HSP70)
MRACEKLLRESRECSENRAAAAYRRPPPREAVSDRPHRQKLEVPGALGEQCPNEEDKTPLDLGIDFGTTRTVVACADRGNHPVVGFQDAAGDTVAWVPSIVAEQGGKLVYGLDAAASGSAHVVRSFKRLLSGAVTPDQVVQVGAVEVALGDLVTGFVAHVHEAIVTRSDVRRAASREVLRAAVAVPANSHSAQRLITLDAFRRAGFASVAMLNEPSAAGFEYTHRHRDTLSSKRDVVVVYDLGGGTFDASVVRMTGRKHEVLGTAGIARLGGDDFDTLLADVALARASLTREALGPAALEKLLDQCRAAKESLNPSSRKVTIDLEDVLGRDAPQADVTVAVSDFYDACAPLVERTVEAMAPLMGRVESEAASPELGDIAGIYVVGGASELPIVARTLRQRFGRRVHRSPYPSAAVAIGLSIAADSGAGFELLDRYSRTFGVFRESESGREITFDPIFTPETELPRGGDQRLTETRAYRAAHNVGHFRFFECGAVDDTGRPRGDMALYGDVYFPFDRGLRETDLTGVRVERRDDDGPNVVERYSLDDNGIVEVVIADLESGYERRYTLARA